MRENRLFKARELVLGWSSSQGPLLDVKHCRDVTSFSDCLKLNVGDKEPRGPPFLEPPFVHFKRPPPPSPPPPPPPLFATSPLLLSSSQASLSSISSFFLSIYFLSFLSSSSSPSPTYLPQVTLRNVSIVLNSIWNLGDVKRGGKKKKKGRTFNRTQWSIRNNCSIIFRLGRFFASFVICPIIYSFLFRDYLTRSHGIVVTTLGGTIENRWRFSKGRTKR